MRRCERCHRLVGEEEFVGSWCGWCDKIVGEACSELAAEPRGW